MIFNFPIICTIEKKSSTFGWKMTNHTRNQVI